jgi:hypothetical protein
MICGLFRGVLKCLRVISTISGGIPTDVLWNPRVQRKPAWDTLVFPEGGTVFLPLLSHL